MKSIAFFQFSTEEDLSYVLEFSGLVLTGRSFEVKIKDRASDTTRATLTNGAGITVSSATVLEAAYAKASMAGWPRGEYSADVVDVTGGVYSRIMAVRFVLDLPGRLVQGVQNRKAYIQWGPNRAYVTSTGPIGPAGPTGAAATVGVGTVTTGAPGSSAAVTNSGTSGAAVLDFAIPRGDKGEPGAAATVGVGTVTTGAPGSAVIITNSGTPNAAILNFTIPEGVQGIQGLTGNKGWSPAFAIVSDGARRVLQVADWVGGEGTKPATGGYVGAFGLTPTIGDAIDIRGEQGPAGSVTDGDKGDVTVSLSGAAWSLNGGVVVDAKVAAPATPSDGILSSKLRFDPGITGPVVRTVQDALRDRHDLRDYNGLDLTGTNDNASLVQAALTDSASNRSRLYAPAGIIALGSTIDFPEGVVLEGRCLPARSWNTNPSPSDGFTWFHLAHTGKGFTLSSGPANQARARQISKIGTFRTQPEPVYLSPYTPNLGIDWDFYGEGVNDLVMDEIMLLNPTLGIGLIGSVAKDCGNARITMGRIWGQPLKSGIHIEHCYDIHRIDGVHFYPFWRLTDEVMTYTDANAEAILSGRNDNPIWGGIFTFGYQRTLHFLQSSALGANVPGGVTSNFQIGKVQCDSTNTGLLVDAAGVNGTIDDYIAWRSQWSPGGLTGTSPTAFYALGDNADIYFGSLRAQYAGNYLGYIGGTGNNIRIGRSTTLSTGTGFTHFSVGAGNRLDIASRPITDGSGTGLVDGSGIFGGEIWRPFTPTLASASGTLTSASATGQWKRVGDTIEWKIAISVTTNGTAAGSLNVTNMPFTAPTPGAIGSGVELVATGRSITGSQYGGTTAMLLKDYAGTYPGADGAEIRVSGSVVVS